jgi:DegV family protein with EDD domain
MESAYSALQEPREGTILSVLKAWSHELKRRAHEEELPELMASGLAAAREALAATPRRLEVLARSHVVDAGGQGFVYFLEGIIDSLRGGHEYAWQPSEAPPHGLPPFSTGHAEIDDRYRFCTEALVSPRDATHLSRDAVMARVAGFGDSLVVAGGESRLRVHIHTNEPQRFLASVAEVGVIEQSKIDDMVLRQLAGREASLAIVTDLTTDLPEDEAFRPGMVAVPLTLSLGDEEYLDGVHIMLDWFIHRIVSGCGVPRSSQPAVADFVQTYRRLLEHREGIVSVHIAGAMSGTVQAARAAAREVNPHRVRVIDSCAVSVGVGLLVEAIGEAIAAGESLDEIEALAERVKRDITIVGTVASLDCAVRGGRVSPRLAHTLDRLHLAPIMVFDETGRPGKGGEVPVVRAGAVLTTHVGLGSVSIAVRRLAG